jgi:hypothetical protein
LAVLQEELPELAKKKVTDEEEDKREGENNRDDEQNFDDLFDD